MTWVQSRLRHPNGQPVKGHPVVATLQSRPNWVVDPAGGRAIGNVETFTDATGLWVMNLMPWSQFEGGSEYVYYQIDEGGSQVWTARVAPPVHPPPPEWPPDQPWEPVWLKDILVDPPDPQPPWPFIDTLASLHDVDRDSVEQAPDGAVLVKQDGWWRAMVPKLANLSDVDPVTMEPANLQIGDRLTYLGSPGWGVLRAPVTLLGWRMRKHPDGQPGKVAFTVTSAKPDRVLLWYWGDEEPGADPTVIEPGTTELEHTYSEGSYSAALAYQTPQEGEGTAECLVSIPIAAEYVECEESTQNV